jgi:hypothetical protein
LLLDAEAMERRIQALMSRCKAHDTVSEQKSQSRILHTSHLVGRCR